MSPLITARRALLTLAALLAAGCQAGAPTDEADPTLAAAAQVTADLAVVAADVVTKDVDMMRKEQHIFGAIQSGFSRCPQGDDGWFHCPAGAGGSLSFALFGASGVQNSWDEEATASVRIITTASGTRSRDTWSAAFQSAREFTVSGLLGVETTRTWDGAGQTTVTRSRHGDGDRVREYTVETTTSVSAVVIPVSGESAWPLSGQTATKLLATANGEVLRERFCVVTFNGTQFVPLTIDGTAYVLDLATGIATPA